MSNNKPKYMPLTVSQIASEGYNIADIQRKLESSATVPMVKLKQFFSPNAGASDRLARNVARMMEGRQ